MNAVSPICDNFKCALANYLPLLTDKLQDAFAEKTVYLKNNIRQQFPFSRFCKILFSSMRPVVDPRFPQRMFCRIFVKILAHTGKLIFIIA
jgi:hypothetical protein